MTRWFRPRNEKRWVSVSEDGYYAVAPIEPGQVEHRAFHIEALWATPVEIGRAHHVDEAQKICDEHRARNGAPA